MQIIGFILAIIVAVIGLYNIYNSKWNGNILDDDEVL